MIDSFWGSKGVPNYPKAPYGQDFDGKMVNLADLDNSVDANSSVMVLSCAF